MNTSESYIAGFCKTAATLGIDPLKLMKTAAVPNAYRLEQLGKTILGTGTKLMPSVGRATGTGVRSGPMEALSTLSRSMLKNPAIANEANGVRRQIESLITAARAGKLRDAFDYFGNAFPKGIPESYKAKLDGIYTALSQRRGFAAGYDKKVDLPAGYGVATKSIRDLLGTPTSVMQMKLRGR